MARMAKVPSKTTGTAMVGINVGAEVLQEQIHNPEDRDDRFDQRFKSTS